MTRPCSIDLSLNHRRQCYDDKEIRHTCERHANRGHQECSERHVNQSVHRLASYTSANHRHDHGQAEHSTERNEYKDAGRVQPCVDSEYPDEYCEPHGTKPGKRIAAPQAQLSDHGFFLVVSLIPATRENTA